MKDAIVLGTRPEIIKCAPIIKQYDKRGKELVIIHSNQHYSRELDEIFFEDLHLRKPDFNLGIGSCSQAEQVGKTMMSVERILIEQKIKRIIVQGDTNTVLGAALAASKSGVKVAHVEAGLRSRDMDMPEEINRIVTDHVSTVLFPPTKISCGNLINERIDPESIHVVGNTIVESILENCLEADVLFKKLSVEMCVDKHGYNLMTIHRPSNVDSLEDLKKLVLVMSIIANQTGRETIFPMHPRTKASIEAKKIDLPPMFKIIEPVGYMEFLALEKNSAMIFTDSGGVQEEACILRRPCVTLRKNTERPETIFVGANILACLDSYLVRKAIGEFNGRKMEYKIPFGDGNTSARIYEILDRN